MADLPDGASLIDRVEDTPNAKGPEELSDTLLERWHDLSVQRDRVAWSALHHHGADEINPRRSPENGTSG